MCRIDNFKITQKEAAQLLDMLKYSLLKELNLPTNQDNRKEFDVIGESETHKFTIGLFCGRKNNKKLNIGARIKKNGVSLLELHIQPGRPHMNPNGEKIDGIHWHIYNEEHGRRWAYSATEINSDDFVESTIMFLDRFHVIEKPKIIQQLEF